MKTSPFYYHPDAPEAGVPTQNEDTTTRGYLPDGEDDFLQLCQSVATEWAKNPNITLVFTTSAEFAAKVTVFEKLVTDKGNVSKLRPGQTKELASLDEEINNAVSQVKREVLNKYETDDGAPYYPVFGIMRRGAHWEFPADQDERLSAIAIMLAGVEAEGLGDKKYGIVFWKDMQTNYKAALVTARNTDKSVSEGSLQKNEVRDYLQNVLQGLLFVLRGNFQQNYQQVYLSWGISKRNR